jgi:hypothetical protein
MLSAIARAQPGAGFVTRRVARNLRWVKAKRARALSKREKCGIRNRVIRAGEERNYMGGDKAWIPIHIECWEVPDDMFGSRPTTNSRKPS